MIEIVKFAVSRGVRYENGAVFGVSGKVLQPRPIGDGYVGFQIPRPNGGFVNVYGHKLVYFLMTQDERAFSPAYEIHHKNGVRSDNKPDNLELMTAYDHESLSSRLNTHSAKIDLATARNIKAEYATGKLSQKALGEKYGLSQQHISDIVNGRKWGEIWDMDTE